MTISFDKTGLIQGNQALLFADSSLRGIGQVMLQNNSFAGVLFLVGIAINSWLLALGVLFGAIISTLVAWLWGANEVAIQSGAFGFNSKPL